MIQRTLTLKMITAGVVEASVTVNNSPIQDYDHPDDHASPTYKMAPGFKSFILLSLLLGTGKTNSPISEWASPITIPETAAGRIWLQSLLISKVANLRHSNFKTNLLHSSLS